MWDVTHADFLSYQQYERLTPPDKRIFLPKCAICLPNKDYFSKLCMALSMSLSTLPQTKKSQLVQSYRVVCSLPRAVQVLTV